MAIVKVFCEITKVTTPRFDKLSGSILLRNGIGQTVRESAGRNSAGNRPAAERSVGHRTEVASPGCTNANRSSSHNEVAVDRPSRIDSGGEELITAMPGAPWNRIGKAV